jgi:hypothetical protein
MKKSVKLLMVLILFNVLCSCEKVSTDMHSSVENGSDESLIGTWVYGTADSLYITDNHTFNKSLNEGIRHTFTYSISNDSIIIQYKGPNKIWVRATAHYYHLDGRELIIDFSNGCYGFSSEKITFQKQ